MPKLQDIFGAVKQFPYAHVRRKRDTGLKGGNSVVDRNDLIIDDIYESTIDGLSLSDSTEVLLPPGEYYVRCYCPTRTDNTTNNNNVVIRLWSKGTVQNELLRSYNHANRDQDMGALVLMHGRFTLTTDMRGIEVRQFVDVARSNNGLGVFTDQAPYEVYVDMRIWKIG